MQDTTHNATRGEAAEGRSAQRRLLLGIAIVAALGLLIEFAVCVLFAYMFEVGPIGNGDGFEVVLSCSAGLLLGFATASVVTCLLFRSWVVGTLLAISVGVSARLAWLISWPIAERIVAALDWYSRYSSTVVYFSDDPGSTEWAILCCIPPGVFVGCIPLLAARAIRRWQLHAAGNVPQSRPFRMEDIFLTTAVIASLLVLLRVPSQLFSSDFVTTVTISVVSAVWFFVLGLGAAMLTPIAFTSKQTSELAVVRSVLLVSLGIGLVLSLVSMGLSGGGMPESAAMMALLSSLGAGFGATICLVGLRVSGLRLASVKTADLLPADVPAGEVEDDADPSNVSRDAELSNFPNRCAAAGLLVIAGIVGVVAGNIESARSRNWETWTGYATQHASAGATVRIRENKLTGLVAGKEKTPAEIRSHLSPDLEALSLRDANIDDAFLQEVAPLLSLSTLDLYGTSISGKGLQSLLDAGHGSFDYLGLGKTQVTPDELKRFLSRCQVKVLDLDGLGFSGEDIENLPRKSISGLVLSGNEITEQWLASYLKDADHLTHLDVTGLPLLGEFLTTLPDLNITSLVLDGTKITDRSIKALRGATQLRTLSIRDTAITAGGLPALPSLNKLFIGAGPITEAQIGRIAMSVQTLVIDRSDFTGEKIDLNQAAVFTLDVSGTSLTDEGLKQVVSTANQSISDLRIANTDVSDEGLRHLATSPVFDLDVSNTQVTVDGLLNLDFLYGTLRIAPGQFSTRELARLRSQVSDIEIGPDELVPRILPSSQQTFGY